MTYTINVNCVISTMFYFSVTSLWNIKTQLMSSTQCKNTKSYEHVNEHTTGRNILTENCRTQQDHADSINLQINLVSDILFLGLDS
jgi:hypothetical protein